MIWAEKGKNDQSFIAVDEFAFLQTTSCDFNPIEAIPTEPPPTTPEPTEPPSGKYLLIYCNERNFRFNYLDFIYF